MRKVRIKSKRHCKRYDKTAAYGICNGWWLALAGRVVYLEGNVLRSNVTKGRSVITGLAIPKYAIAKQL